MNQTRAFVVTAVALGGLGAVLAIRDSRVNQAPVPVPVAVPAARVQVGTEPAPVPVVASGDGPLTLQGRLNSSYVLVGTTEARAIIDVVATPDPERERRPVNLAVVIDRSGSMMGQKLADARDAASSLVDQLEPTDRLAIVAYDDSVRFAKSELATEAGKERMREFINSITCGGSTDIAAGLRQAATLISPLVSEYASNRIILITDGQPTAGIVDPRQLLQVAALIHRDGMAVTTLGVGSDFNAVLMRGMAESGAGFYGYLEDTTRLEDIFSRELQQAATAVARQVEVKLTLPPGVELIDLLGRPSTVSGNTVTTSLYDLSGGLSAHLVARLRVKGGEAGTTRSLVQVQLSYTDVLEKARRDSRIELTAAVTPEAEVVAAHVDGAAETLALHAIGAGEIERATEAFRNGDRDEAFGLLDNVRSLFSSSSYALAGDTAQVDSFKAQMSSAKAGDTNRVTASLQQKNLANFGGNLDNY